MRINRFIAMATGISRRQADELVAQGRVTSNNQPAQMGQIVTSKAVVRLDGKVIHRPVITTVMLHKPVGYVTSRRGQGAKTIYDLLPPELHHLKPVGRLDKDSSGLLLLTNDGQLAHTMTHPSKQKPKIYEVSLDKPLQPADHQRLEQGVALDDGLSRLQLIGQGKDWTVTIHEGRNRQIRRSFAALVYQVTRLHRIQFGNYYLKQLGNSRYIVL